MRRGARGGRGNWREYTESDIQSSGTSSGWAREQLEALPASHREAFVLVEVLGLSESQAGLAMHLSRPVVGAKKRCATVALRDKARRLDGTSVMPPLDPDLRIPRHTQRSVHAPTAA